MNKEFIKKSANELKTLLSGEKLTTSQLEKYGWESADKTGDTYTIKTKE